MLVTGDDIGASGRHSAFENPIIARILGYDIQGKIGIYNIRNLDNQGKDVVDLRLSESKFRVDSTRLASFKRVGEK